MMVVTTFSRFDSWEPQGPGAKGYIGLCQVLVQLDWREAVAGWELGRWWQPDRGWIEAPTRSFLSWPPISRSSYANTNDTIEGSHPIKKVPFRIILLLVVHAAWD